MGEAGTGGCIPGAARGEEVRRLMSLRDCVSQFVAYQITRHEGIRSQDRHRLDTGLRHEHSVEWILMKGSSTTAIRVIERATLHLQKNRSRRQGGKRESGGKRNPRSQHRKLPAGSQPVRDRSLVHTRRAEQVAKRVRKATADGWRRKEVSHCTWRTAPRLDNGVPGRQLDFEVP